MEDGVNFLGVEFPMILGKIHDIPKSIEQNWPLQAQAAKLAGTILNDAYVIKSDSDSEHNSEETDLNSA